MIKLMIISPLFRGKSTWINLEQYDKKWFEMGQGNNESDVTVAIKDIVDLQLSTWSESFQSDHNGTGNNEIIEFDI